MIAWRPVREDKRGAHIPNAVIDTAMNRHADGFGIAWREKGELRVEKFGPDERAEFREVLKRVDLAGLEYVTHFRWATHGPKDRDHAHPFEYTDATGEKVVVFHNGIIDIATRPEESDTEVFVRDVLAKLPANWWDSPALVYLVGEAIGYSKLVIMTRFETISLHDKRGNWDGGIWYSSDHKPTKWSSGSTYTSGKGWEDSRNRGTSSVCVHKRDYLEECVDCGRAEYVPSKGNLTTAKGQKGLVTAPKGVTAATTALTVVSGGAPADDEYDRPDEWDDIDGALGLLPARGRGRTLRHAGHTLSLLQDVNFARDGEYEDGVICNECQTLGDLYVIDGQTYPDLAHLYGYAAEAVEDTEAYVTDMVH